MGKVFCAPLQGYTDKVYRETHARLFGGVDAYYTPFVRLEKKGFRNRDVRDVTSGEEDHTHVIPQLIASTPDEFRLIVHLFQEKSHKEVNINLGCPFPMQARNHKGAGLLAYPDEAALLLETVKEFPEISFSVKMRLGWDHVEESLALLPLLNRLPLSHVVMHPRLGIWQYKGELDMEGFSRFYEACEKPLLFNGDLVRLEEIRSIEERYPKLMGVMIGRGLLASPWLAVEYVSAKPLSLEEKRAKLIAFHASLLDSYSTRLEGGEHQILTKMKTLWDYLLPEADKKLRKKVLKSNSLISYRAAVADLLNH